MQEILNQNRVHLKDAKSTKNLSFLCALSVFVVLLKHFRKENNQHISKINKLLTSYCLTFTLFLLSLFIASCDNSTSISTNNRQIDSNALTGAIIVYAAASLTDSVQEIAANFEKENPNIKVCISVGSSAQLAKQIVHGAPADIFLSANVKWMDYLESRGLIESKSRIEPLGNRLAIISNISNENTIATVQGLLTDKIRFFAISDYNSVPAGIYAKQALIKLNIWQDLLPKLVIGNDARVTIAYVERNEADYGIVYITDARISKNVKEVFTLPEDCQPTIRYSFSTIKGTLNESAANAFANYLKSASSRNVFDKYGFKWLLE